MLPRMQAAVVLPAPPLGDEKVMTGMCSSLKAVWFRKAVEKPLGNRKLPAFS